MKRGSLFDVVCEGAARVPRGKPALLTANASLSYGGLMDGARGALADQVEERASFHDNPIRRAMILRCISVVPE